jgi:hypothetical protein
MDIATDLHALLEKYSPDQEYTAYIVMGILLNLADSTTVMKVLSECDKAEAIRLFMERCGRP